jgi:diadenosine tetraphosphate (Ap4A) HIT family hydrolase
MTSIHPQLEKDCLIIGKFQLCYLLLSKDARYPWFILVPDRDNISEIYQLNESDQMQLMKESCQLSEALYTGFNADKLNIAALGNVVPQLHIHHIVRYKNDPVWPAPIWGKLESKPYEEDQLNALLMKIKGMDLADFSYSNTAIKD